MTFATRAGAWLAGAVTALALAGPAAAETPADTFVMAKDISDIITLDPAEVFEFTGGEVIAQLYDRVMFYEPDDLTNLVGGVVESWEVTNDGKTITFTMRPDQTFASGNPVTAEDVVYSLRRVIKLNKTPSFIFTQFGWTPENVDDLVKVVDGDKPQITITSDLSPELVLNALSAGVASVVDMKVVQEHEVAGDMGYEWLKSNSAGSGPFVLTSWKANELVSMEANPDYRLGAPGVERVIVRHVAEPSAQLLLVENGDVDLARDLTPDQIAGIEGDALNVQEDPKAALIYLAANQDHEILGNPKVMEALKYLIDYKGMADSFLKGQFIVHQAAWPEGLWAAYNETPYSLNVEKAKALLAEAGYPDGFEIQLHTLNASPYPEIAQSVQATLAQAGIEASIQTAEGKTLWPMYRSRKHELIIAQWSPDYVDPHSNLDAFGRNPDNSMEAQLTGVLAWRNAWADEDMNTLVTAAAEEQDRARREQMYQEIQKKLQEIGPYAIMFQQVEQSVMRDDMSGYVSGPTFDLVFYRTIEKE